MKKLVIVMTVGLIALNGCGHKFHLKKESLSTPGVWTCYRGDLAATGAIGGGTYDGSLDVVWEASSRDKPSGPLTLQYGCLAYPGSKGKTRMYDQITGAYLGTIGSARRTSQTGLATSNGCGCWATSPPRDRLVCINLLKHRELWDNPVKDAAAGTIILENRVLVASSPGQLAAYGLEDGRPVWSFESPVRLVAPPAFADGVIFQPADQGLLFFVNAENGEEIAQVKIEGSLVNAVAVGALVYAADMQGHAYGIDRGTAAIVWRSELPGNTWTAPTLADDRLFFGCSDGVVVALDAVDGRELWRFETGEVIRASIIAVGEVGVVGTLAGSLISFRLSDGRTIERRELRGGLEITPVSDGEHVYVATRAGKITCFGVRDVAEQPDRQRSRSQSES
ncbi:MAG TPA: PQQ-binding-like beta-propeller repeat protein [candidate division Zixibacteria bacterium]|nr:PQQ-binding-like beta-propeller repeat protein [candidate division Zixibacteria bacterium]